MCGIVGYCGKSSAPQIIYEGLKRLEYRGYDSAGIATLSDGRICTVKKQGRVNCLEGEIEKLSGNVGIGHTRWATHGSPSDKNAHPHSAGEFTLVHNGIIENYDILREKYLQGERFNSDTDSEVIVKLLQKFFDGDLLATVNKVVHMLTGSYAIVIMCAHFEGLIVAKNKSPVILGFGEGENFVSSDAPALAGYCKQISVLEDNDIAVINGNGVAIFDENLQHIVRPRLENSAKKASLELGDNPHYMLKEIREVPQSIERTYTAYPSVEEKLKGVFDGVKRVIIIGCGTAYNSGLVAKCYIERLARIITEVEIAGEFRYKNPIVENGTLVIAISQSGETADTVEAAKLARSLGAKVVAVTNSPYSELTRCADAVVPVEAGSEICVAATKSYTGQITALYLIANTLAGNNSEDAIARLSALPELCRQTLECAGIDALADMCARSGSVYFLGRDMDYALALEGSLKLKEVSYIPSEGYPAGELKHGTLALMDIKAVAVVIITCPNLAAKCENAVQQVISRRGKVAVISNVEGIERGLDGKAQLIKIPECDKYLSPLLSAVVLQLLAYKTALLLERDPDKPRNLAKSVTVE